MKKILTALTVVTAFLLLPGCNKVSTDETGYSDPGTAQMVNDYPYIVTDSGVFVKRDGTVISSDVEEFAEDYYDVDEFEEDYLVPVVKSYNEKQNLPYSRAEETSEVLPVSIYGLEKSGDNLILQLMYKDASEYLAFNKEINSYFENWETFVVCEYSDLADNGISLDADFLDMDGNSADINTVKTTSGLYACVLGFNGALPTDFSGKFQFEGEVVYMTEGIVVQGENSVRVYDSDSLQYILFK